MPRESYYRAVGNPVVRDQLPASPPTVPWTHPPLSAGAQREALLQLALGSLSIPLVVGMLQHLVASGAPLPSTSLVLGGLLLYAGGAAWSGLALRDISARCVCLAAVGWSLLAPPALAGLMFLMTLAWGAIAWQLGWHVLVLATAAPMSRSTARTVTRGLLPWLLFAALVPATLFLLGRAFHVEWFAVCSLLAVLIVPLLQSLWFDIGTSPYRLATSALASFWSDNAGDWQLPGLQESPAGLQRTRRVTLLTSVVLVAVVVGRWSQAADQRDWAWCPPAQRSPRPVSQTKRPDRTRFETIRDQLRSFTLLELSVVVSGIGVPLLLSWTVLVTVRRVPAGPAVDQDWTDLIHDLQQSPHPIEQDSYFQGRIAADGSPLLVPSKVFADGAHFVGRSGSGKTALGLCPWIEQTVQRGKATVIVMDLKADTLELLASLSAAAPIGRTRSGQRLPLKFLTLDSQWSTYACNVLTQSFWDRLTTNERTEILCGAAGLTYGIDYGPGWFQEANAAVLHHVVKQIPEARTFRELAEHLKRVLANKKQRELLPALLEAGTHVQLILERWGTIAPLNAVPSAELPATVLTEQLDLTDLYRQPQLVYLHLSSIKSSQSAPDVARLFVYALLSATKSKERQHPVYLVIDEFQRMVGHNVEYLMQLARSTGVGVILANQSLEDLGDLVNAVETNCRYRQWFDVSSLADRWRIMRTSGETVETFASHTESVSGGTHTESQTVAERLVPRLSVNDIAAISDNPRQSIVTVAGGDGFAQYGGLPVVVESDFHIGLDAYKGRKAFEWPTNAPGTFVPRDLRPPTPPVPPPAPGPIWTEEQLDALGLAPRSPQRKTNAPSRPEPPRPRRRRSSQEPTP